MVRYRRDQFLIGLVEKCASLTGGDDIFEGETLMMRRIYRKCSSLVGSLWLPQGTNQDLSGERCQLDIFEGERSQSGDLDDEEDKAWLGRLILSRLW